MVNTRSEANRVPRDDRNAREEGNSNDPQLTRLNERMKQMAKSIEDLATMNAVLQARVPELHQTVTDPENREALESHIGERREEERHEVSRVEGSGERNGRE
jgi:chromosome segregation ATPase